MGKRGSCRAARVEWLPARIPRRRPLKNDKPSAPVEALGLRWPGLDQKLWSPIRIVPEIPGFVNSNMIILDRFVTNNARQLSADPLQTHSGVWSRNRLSGDVR